MGRLSASLVALALCASPASACINDEELPNHEREFRSTYGRSAAPSPLASAVPIGSWVLAVGGATMLFGAAALAFAGPRSGK